MVYIHVMISRASCVCRQESERSYEKLVRIYGDMIQEDKLAQMADGIHVLGDSV